MSPNAIAYTSAEAIRGRLLTSDAGENVCECVPSQLANISRHWHSTPPITERSRPMPRLERSRQNTEPP